MSPETFVEYTEYFIAGMLTAHFAYSLCFLIIASHMIIEYEKMIFLKPDSHKITIHSSSFLSAPVTLFTNAY